MASIKVKWAGAQDDTQIKGYELSWRLSGDTIWNVESFIETNETFGEFILDSPVEGNVYEFRVRVQDISDNWSLTYTYGIASYINFGNPPLAPSSVTLEARANSIVINWSGGYDGINVKGYEVSWKEISASTYNVEAIIETKFGYGTYELTGLTVQNEYDIQLRTINVYDEYSAYSDKQSIATIPPYTYLISSDFRLVSDEYKCDIAYPDVEVYSTVLKDSFLVGDKIYSDALLTSVFKGSGNWYRLGNPGYTFNTYQINDYGEIIEYLACAPYEFQYDASSFGLDYTVYTVEDACTELSYSGNTVFTNKHITALGFGDYLYLRPDYTTPLYGQGNIWLIGGYGVQITNNGMILEIGQCPTLP